MTSFETPVLLIIFNRPDKVRALIDALAKVKPRKLYIMADGPRPDKPKDIKNCTEARDIATDIPWECEVHTNFLEQNIGCDQAVPAGIDWFFDTVEEGIILEDDCIPDPTFFSFCAELLAHYRTDERVMHISGNNFHSGTTYGDGSYYFSNYSHSWGWATWKRAWKHYHTAVADFPAYDQANRINEIPFSKQAKKFWLKHLRNTAHWDSMWQYTIWHAGGVSIHPNQNLVTNIGFGADATHTLGSSKQANILTQPIIQIQHPLTTEPNHEADEYTYRHLFYKSIPVRILVRINDIIKRII